jgi:hypothetical protein
MIHTVLSRITAKVCLGDGNKLKNNGRDSFEPFIDCVRILGGLGLTSTVKLFHFLCAIVVDVFFESLALLGGTNNLKNSFDYH